MSRAPIDIVAGLETGRANLSERSALSMEPGVATARIAFSWNGLPQFAARLFRAAIDRLGEPCAVVGSRPSVPVTGMEQVLGQNVLWVDANQPISWNDINLAVPEIFVQSGWSYPAFSALGREVKRRGGYVIGLCDTNWRGDLRQLVLGPLAFRLHHLKYFDAVLVAGRKGAQALQYFGMAPDRIRIGMLGADPRIFGGGPPLVDRPQTFIFVGRYEPVKNVERLVRAFQVFAALRPGWTLRLCGSGDLRDRLPNHPQLLIEDFVQPEELASRFHAARFFVLPSVIEPWGVVVHEAALCGCPLLLSDAVGSGADLATPTNSLLFSPHSDSDILRTLLEAADKDARWLAAAEAESRALAKRFGPDRFGEEIARLVHEFGSAQNAKGGK